MNIDFDAVLNVASQVAISAGLLAIVIKGALQYVFTKELERLKTHLGLVQKLKTDEQTQMLQKQREAVLALWNSIQKVIDVAEAVKAATPSDYPNLEAELVNAIKDIVQQIRKDKIYYPSEFDPTVKMVDQVVTSSDIAAILTLFEKVESSLSILIKQLYLEDLNRIMMKQ